MTSPLIIRALLVTDACLSVVLAYRVSLHAVRTPRIAATNPSRDSFILSPAHKDSDELKSFTGEQDRFHWHMLNPDDLKQYVVNLRNIECPEETVRSVILGEVTRRFAPREMALRLRGADCKPWETPSSHALARLERKLKSREIVREKRILLHDLLGYEVLIEVQEMAAHPDEEKYEAAYQELPIVKRWIVRSIQDAYWEKCDNLLARTLGHLEPEDREELHRLQVERRTALEGALTPRELEDFELQTSRTAERVRSQLSGLDATNDEIRAVFRAMRATWEDPRESASLSSEDDQVARDLEAAPDNSEDQLRLALGDSRYEELVRSRTPEFKRLVAIQEQLGLDRDRVSRAYEIEVKAVQELGRIEGDASLSSEEQQAAVEKLGTETEKALQLMLGPSGLQMLKDSGQVLPGRATDNDNEGKQKR